jgi:hypothetical protein
MLYNGIGCLLDATSHWTSNVDGVIKANAMLYDEMKKAPSFYYFISEMEKLLRDKIKKIDLDSYIKNAAVEV